MKKTHAQKFVGVGLIVLGGLLATYVLVFIGYKLFFSFSIAEMLPKERTVAFAEMTISPLNGQFISLVKQLGDYDGYSSDDLAGKINEIFGVDFEKDVEPWRGNHLGLALMKSEKDSRITEPVYLIEVRNREKAEQFLEQFKTAHPDEKLMEQKEGGITIYHYNLASNYKFAFINGFMAIAPKTELLVAMAQTVDGVLEPIKDTSLFTASKEQFGWSPFIYGYIDAQEALKSSFPVTIIHDVIPLKTAYYLPLLKSYEGVTLAATVQKGEVTIQSLMQVQKQYLENGTYFRPEKVYQPRIIGKIPEEDVTLILGGTDLSSQIKKLHSTVQTISPGIGSQLNSDLEQVGRSLLPNLKAANTLLSLLGNEYAVVMHGTFANPSFTLVIDRSRETLDENFFNIVTTALQKISVDLAPTRRTVTLEDGTVAEELIRDFSKISAKKTQENGIQLTSFEDPQGRSLLSFAVNNEYIMFSTNKEKMKGMLETMLKDVDENLIDKRLGRLRGNYDEVTSGNLTKILETSKFLSEDQKAYLKPFSTIQSSKEIFDNGVRGYYTMGIE